MHANTTTTVSVYYVAVVSLCKEGWSDYIATLYNAGSHHIASKSLYHDPDPPQCGYLTVVGPIAQQYAHTAPIDSSPLSTEIYLSSLTGFWFTYCMRYSGYVSVYNTMRYIPRTLSVDAFTL